MEERCSNSHIGPVLDRIQYFAGRKSTEQKTIFSIR